MLAILELVSLPTDVRYKIWMLSIINLLFNIVIEHISIQFHMNNIKTWTKTREFIKQKLVGNNQYNHIELEKNINLK